MSESWVPTVTTIGCDWDEILVTVYGFGAARWEKCAQSRGFGTHLEHLKLGVRGGIPWGGWGWGVGECFVIMIR